MMYEKQVEYGESCRKEALLTSIVSCRLILVREGILEPIENRFGEERMKDFFNLSRSANEMKMRQFENFNSKNFSKRL